MNKFSKITFLVFVAIIITTLLVLPVWALEEPIDYKTQLRPDPGVSGEPVKFIYTIINTSKTQNLHRVKFNLVFSPDTGDPAYPKDFGKFQNANGSSCSVSTPPDSIEPSSSLGEGIIFSDKAYSYQCTINYLAAGKEESFHFTQEKAVAGVTGYDIFVSSDQTEDKHWPGHIPLDVRPANPELSVTIDPISKPHATGKKSETLITVTNTGNARIVDPTINVELSEDALPFAVYRYGKIDKSVSVMQSLDLNAGVELADGRESPNVEIHWDDKGFHAQIVDDSEFSDGPAFLKPGDSRRVKVSFVPSQGGPLNFTAIAKGKSFDGKEVLKRATTSAQIEEPVLVMSLLNVNPEAYGHTEEPSLPLHKGNKITLNYVLRNKSQNAVAKYGILRVQAVLGGETLSITSPDKKVDCEEISTPQHLGECKIAHLKAGEELKFSATYLHEPPSTFLAQVTSTSAETEYRYETAAKIDPVVQVKFDPDPEQNIISPGTVITAQFVIRNTAEDVLSGRLIVRPQADVKKAPVRVADITGCVSKESLFRGKIMCTLPRFSSKNSAKINTSYSAISEKDKGEFVTIDWELKLPLIYHFKPNDKTRGSVSYKIVPQYADLYIDGYEDLGESLPGKIEPVKLEIGNKGSVAQERVFLELNLNVSKGKGTNESPWRHVPLPEGKESWVKQPTLVKEDDRGKSYKSKCRQRGSIKNDFFCPLGTLDPGELTFAYIEFDQDLPTGVTYFYEAKFNKNGVGEGTAGGSLDDNKIMGSGRVEESTQCTSQEPVGQAVITSPRDGSEAKPGTIGRGSFNSVPEGVELWGYTWAPLAERYWFFPIEKTGGTSGTWKTNPLGLGRKGKADIGYIYKFGVGLADECSSDRFRDDRSGISSVPDGVRITDEINVKRVGE